MKILSVIVVIVAVFSTPMSFFPFEDGVDLGEIPEGAQATQMEVESPGVSPDETPLEIAVEASVEKSAEEAVEIPNEKPVEKRRPKKKDIFEFIRKIQRFFFQNETNASNDTPAWNITDFEKHGFNMSAFLGHINNRTMMQQAAELLVKYGLDRYVLVDSSAESNQTLTVNLPQILRELDVLGAIDALEKAGVIPFRRDKRPHRFGKKGGRGGNRSDSDCNDDETNNDARRDNKKNRNNNNRNDNNRGGKNKRGGNDDNDCDDCNQDNSNRGGNNRRRGGQDKTGSRNRLQFGRRRPRKTTPTTPNPDAEVMSDEN